MNQNSKSPVLYIDEDPGCDEAIAMLERAGCTVCVKMAPTYYRAVYGLPVLFGLFNKYEGLDGIRVFLENSMQCHSTSENAQDQDFSVAAFDLDH